MHLAMKFSLQTDQPVPEMAYKYMYTSAIVPNLLIQHFTFVLAYAFFQLVPAGYNNDVWGALSKAVWVESKMVNNIFLASQIKSFILNLHLLETH